MNFWLDLAPPIRTILLAVAGACLGSLVNWAIYTLAYDARPISPWAAPTKGVQRRRWARLPIVGWWSLRSESSLHGEGFWLRPMLLEIVCAAFLPFFYAFVVEFRGLLPDNHRFAAPAMDMLLAEFCALAALFTLMLAATFIDFDEKTIPDAITVPGTLLGLSLAVLLPDAMLPVVKFFRQPGMIPEIRPLHLTSPGEWPSEFSDWTGLAIGLGCFCWWCFALCERPWRMSRGFVVACKLFFARLLRGLFSPFMLSMLTLGIVGIALTWRFGGPRWDALLTALVGLAIGGGMIWLVRLIGQVTLRKEAMGFGDVTLLAMMGTYLGWQACVIVFFIAPLAGLCLGVVQYISKRENEIPYGPFLCLAAIVVIFAWAALWDHVRQFFWMGWTILGVLAVGFVLMGVMLFVWRLFSERFLSAEADE